MARPSAPDAAARSAGKMNGSAAGRRRGAAGRRQSTQGPGSRAAPRPRSAKPSTAAARRSAAARCGPDSAADQRVRQAGDAGRADRAARRRHPAAAQRRGAWPSAADTQRERERPLERADRADPGVERPGQGGDDPQPADRLRATWRRATRSARTASSSAEGACRRATRSHGLRPHHAAGRRRGRGPARVGLLRSRAAATSTTITRST